MTKEGEGLVHIASEIINSRREALQISPAWIATEVMNQLDTMGVRATAPLIYIGCHMQLKQVARALCRGMFEPRDDRDHSAQHELFPDLQWRYPAARSVPSEDPIYILLEEMTDADVNYNVSRLRAEGQAKIQHAAALQAWNANRKFVAQSQAKVGAM
jgi:hypothetical protein